MLVRLEFISMKQRVPVVHCLLLTLLIVYFIRKLNNTIKDFKVHNSVVLIN